MKSYYNLIDKMFTYLDGNPNVNTVTFGDIMDVDLTKQTIFPLVHVTVSSMVFSEQTINANIKVAAMDIVDESKDDKQTKSKPHLGLDNKQDILNTQLTVINGLQSTLRRGDLYTDLYQLTQDATAQLFQDQYENLLTGWTMDLNILIPNNDMGLINRDGSQCS
tara:strand:- start:585 stop:1076 length:492 start_codon:yes stop_codon:yes gene_type:complete